MTRQPVVGRRAEQLLGRAVVSTAPLAGGDVATTTKLRLSDGTTAVMKTMHQTPPGMFAREAAGLAWLGEVPGGVRTPEVLAQADDALVLAWVETTRPGTEAASAFGRALAATHAAGAPAYGAEQDGWIATLPLPQRSSPTWAEFYAVRRVLPYLKLARDRGQVTETDAATVEAVVGRLTELVPEEPPARLHGDLWNGNVLWAADGAWLIDPAATGGHRESDLAMLALFGLPNLERMLEAYTDRTPLADGWQDRIGLHQLFPLLVHACLFGGGYGARAAAVAARYV